MHARIDDIFSCSVGVGGYGGQDNLAMDYRAAGFRECAAEVVRYLDSVEGLDTQNPLRLRIVSHLSRFIGQKEFFPNPAGSTGATWNHGTPNVGGIGPHQVEQLAMAAAAAAASHNSYSLHDHQHNGSNDGRGWRRRRGWRRWLPRRRSQPSRQ